MMSKIGTTEMVRGTTEMVREVSRRHAESDGVDLLMRTECHVIGELVQTVHKQGQQGTAWPTVQRELCDRTGVPYQEQERAQTATLLTDMWRITALCVVEA